MGQSQLLMILIGVLIIGIAILAASGFFDSGQIDANRKALVGDISQIAHLAVRYYMRPIALGGGGHSYVGFTIPNKFQSDLNGKFRAAVVSPTILQVTAISALDSTSSVVAEIDTYGKVSNWIFTGEFE